MASTQLEKPYEESSHQIEHSTYHRKTSTSEIRHNKNNSTNTHEHSLCDKVKDMAHSARKLFNHHGPDHNHNTTTNCSSGVKKKTDMKKKKKKIVKNTQGQHEGHCMPKMLDQVKNLKKKKKKKNEEERYSDSGSSSDNDITKKKK